MFINHILTPAPVFWWVASALPGFDFKAAHVSRVP